VQQGGFARAYRASDNREAFALKNALKEDLEGCAVRIGQMQKSRVRCKAKRFFF
jgi:hypothetical protein